jgi:predicted hotdog family 3-hydroxylacyl-ACP dehydratase
MDTGLISLDELIAHRDPMRLIDRIVEISETHAVAETEIRSDSLFFSAARNVPAYVGLEMMAQTIAAIDGMTRRNAGQPPKIGFLLGCRRYNAACAAFAERDLLTTFATMVFTDGAMFSFDCKIERAGKEIANASLNVYAPSNPQTLLEGQSA